MIRVRDYVRRSETLNQYAYSLVRPGYHLAHSCLASLLSTVPVTSRKQDLVPAPSHSLLSFFSFLHSVPILFASPSSPLTVCFSNISGNALPLCDYSDYSALIHNAPVSYRAIRHDQTGMLLPLLTMKTLHVIMWEQTRHTTLLTLLLRVNDLSIMTHQRRW